MMATAGAGAANFAGQIVADLPATVVQALSLEPPDVLSSPQPSVIDFDLALGSGEVDEFEFAFPIGATISVTLDDPGQAGDFFVGQSKWPIAQMPLDLTGW